MLQVHVYGDRSRLYETRSAILNIIGKYNGTCKKKNTSERLLWSWYNSLVNPFIPFNFFFQGHIQKVVCVNVIFLL